MAKPVYPTEAKTDDYTGAFGTIRIARVTYDHKPISANSAGKYQSLGAMVDDHIMQAFVDGANVGEVALIFETQEAQQKLKELYHPLLIQRANY